MEVTQRFDLPFENEYDWRVTLFSTTQDFFQRALLEEIKKYKIDDNELVDWKNRDGIMRFAIEDKLIERVKQRTIRDVKKWLD